MLWHRHSDCLRVMIPVPLTLLSLFPASLAHLPVLRPHCEGNGKGLCPRALCLGRNTEQCVVASSHIIDRGDVWLKQPVPSS